MIAESIAEYLDRNGVTPNELCRRAGLSENAVNGMLSGEYKLSVDEYSQICAALGLPLNYFFEASPA